jgi:hypothetical protein
MALLMAMIVFTALACFLVLNTPSARSHSNVGAATVLVVVPMVTLGAAVVIRFDIRLLMTRATNRLRRSSAVGMVAMIALTLGGLIGAPVRRSKTGLIGQFQMVIGGSSDGAGKRRASGFNPALLRI